MEDENLLKELREAELAIADAEKRHGREHIEVADKLMKYASLLRQTNKRALDAVNVEARAKAIRAKLFAEEAQMRGGPAVPLIRPVAEQRNPSIYLGLGGMMVALSALFINGECFLLMTMIAVILAAGDVVVSRGVWWRALLTVVFLVTGWWGMQSLPAIMLVDASPVDRLNYATDNPELVALIRKLGKPTQALNYRLCLPEGFVKAADERPDWGRVITFNNPAHPNTAMYLMVINPNDEQRKQYRSYSPAKAAKEIVLPDLYDLLDVDEVKQESAKFVDVNGKRFSRVGFMVKSASDGAQKRGFVYVSKQHNRFIALAACQPFLDSAENLEALDGSVSTFSEQGSANVLDQ